MTETPNPETLDLIGLLSGRDYPTLDIEVYFNEELGFEINRLQKDLEAAENRSDLDKLKEIESKMDSKLKEVQDQRFVVTLKAIPESVRRRINSKIQEEFPDKTDLLGRSQPNPGADEAFTKKIWQAYIVSVTSPDGRMKLVDESDVDAMFANAPVMVHEAIIKGIQELQTGSKSGFELAAKEVDFLSQASPEG